MLNYMTIRPLIVGQSYTQNTMTISVGFRPKFKCIERESIHLILSSPTQNLCFQSVFVDILFAVQQSTQMCHL